MGNVSDGFQNVRKKSFKFGGIYLTNSSPVFLLQDWLPFQEPSQLNYLLIDKVMDNRIHTFPRSSSAMWNTNSLVQVWKRIAESLTPREVWEYPPALVLINSFVYMEKQMLNVREWHLTPFLRALPDTKPNFMQGNSPYTKIVKRFFEAENVEVMLWPAKSSGLNPVENFLSGHGQTTVCGLYMIHGAFCQKIQFFFTYRKELCTKEKKKTTHPKKQKQNKKQKNPQKNKKKNKTNNCPPQANKTFSNFWIFKTDPYAYGLLS